MNQPDLGLKVTELRQGRGFTQEQLAEACEVSQRTIQRIESGEVDPRAYTLQCLTDALDFDFLEDSNSSENLWLVVLHLSSILSVVVIPLLLWAWKKNQSYKIDKQARVVVNFQITMALALFANLFLLMLAATVFIFLGEMDVQSPLSSPTVLIATLILPLPMILIGVFCTYQGVVNAMRSMSDRPVHYPLSIPFMK
jgi:uncharacterized Tic20 family protein/DNA-binding XRE family transcriptional regulator|tara:strand:+ start:1717 stop:2307 length:591 start_codon:yes stop_codon:yes gene_type:complete